MDMWERVYVYMIRLDSTQQAFSEDRLYERQKGEDRKTEEVPSILKEMMIYLGETGRYTATVRDQMEQEAALMRLHSWS